MEFSLPIPLRNLKLQPMNEEDAIHLIEKLKDDGYVEEGSTNVQDPLSPIRPYLMLQSLSLVLNVIFDELVISITENLPLLVEIDLEDRRSEESISPHDLTNIGFHSLGSCERLTTLSIVRSRQNYRASFTRITTMAMYLFTVEHCQGLKSVRLGGFSMVSFLGFSEILNSCPDLEKFEVGNALLKDAAFDDMPSAARSLVEFRTLGCSDITSEAVSQLAPSRIFEVLDLCGCRGIGDTWLSYISEIYSLTTLNLGGTNNVTNYGLAVPGRENLPIALLFLRGCQRITDEGIARLLHDGGRIRKTLKSLDLGHMPRISDATISTIALAGRAVTELCIRFCFRVTAASLEALASEIRLQGGYKQLRKLDLCNCIKLSNESVALFQERAFHGLRWLGVAVTSLGRKANDFAIIYNEQPWLTVCFLGCEIGCHNGWQFHE